MGRRCGPVARPAAEGAPAMSTVACPGCGMPRATELIGETPCPVCGEIPPIAEELEPEPAAPSAPVPEPALPADASELAAWNSRGLTSLGSPRAGFAVP